jgi:L-fuculose-phosphate aldolase
MNPGQSDPATALVAFGRRLRSDGLAVGTAGNLSVRIPTGLLITPTGVDYDDLTVNDLAHVDPAGRHVGGLHPSSELPMHRAIYAARADVGAIVHTHSLQATILACSGRAIPAVHYLVGMLGGAVPLVPYRPYGTEELGESVASELAGGYQACLLANHGAVAVGADLRQAYQRAQLVEWLAALYVGTLHLGGATLLSAEEMSRVTPRLSHYGQPDAQARDT